MNTNIILNIKYPLYWNEQRTKVLLKVTWAVTIATAVGASVAHYYTKIDFHLILDLYLYPTYVLVFLVCSLYFLVFC